MENFETIENVLAIIAIIIPILIVLYQLKKSRDLVILQLRKNKNLETIKYLSIIRKEIWDLTDYNKLTDFVQEEKDNDTEKVRAVNQKLEYIAAAINNDDLSIKLIKDFCGRWFQGAVRITGIVDDKKEKYEEEKYGEIHKLYNKLNEEYK